MAFGFLRRFDVQAKWALVLALISVVPLGAAIYLVMSRFNAELQQIVYGSEGRFVPVFLGCVLSSSFPAAVGFLLGWNSAGRRRNEKSALSWTAFFVGGAVLTANAIALIAFFWLGLEQVA